MVKKHNKRGPYGEHSPTRAIIILLVMDGYDTNAKLLEHFSQISFLSKTTSELENQGLLHKEKGRPKKITVKYPKLIEQLYDRLNIRFQAIIKTLGHNKVLDNHNKQAYEYYKEIRKAKKIQEELIKLLKIVGQKYIESFYKRHITKQKDEFKDILIEHVSLQKLYDGIIDACSSIVDSNLPLSIDIKIIQEFIVVCNYVTFMEKLNTETEAVLKSIFQIKSDDTAIEEFLKDMGIIGGDIK